MRYHWIPVFALLTAITVFAGASTAGAENRIGLADARIAPLPPSLGRADPDGDGLSTWTEIRRTHTNPRKFDTDGDGYGDGREVRDGSDPLDPRSTPLLFHAASLFPPPAAAPAADTTPPETTIDSGPEGIAVSTNALFSFSSSEPGSSFQCRLDSGSWGSCSSPRNYSSLTLGEHSFAVRATDPAGNVDPTPATSVWEAIDSEPPIECSETLAPGSNVSSAISRAPGGAVICLESGSYSTISGSGIHKSPLVTVASEPGSRATVDGVSLLDPAGLRFQTLDITGGISFTPSASNVQLIGNDITGNSGIYFFGDYRIGKQVNNVLIEGNHIHDIDYTGAQLTSFGYGIEGVGDARNVVVYGNTIERVAADYIQSASPVGWTVDRNTFLGPSLEFPNHPNEHQDLWQIFGGGDDIVFSNNVARDTETQESLLFQEGTFHNVVVENNLFDHDSHGYTCQILQAQGLIFRGNTIVGSRWGCLFRDLPPPAGSSEPGSGYQIDHNVFTDTGEGFDVSTEGDAASWGTYDYNVSSDGSASGAHSVRNWLPSWVDSVDYLPQGLPFAAGYRVP